MKENHGGVQCQNAYSTDYFTLSHSLTSRKPDRKSEECVCARLFDIIVVNHIRGLCKRWTISF